MSSEERADARATRRGRRAEADVRAAHRIARGILTRYSQAGDAWREARGSAWSPAETVLHLALTASSVLYGLRVAAAGRSRRPRPRGRTLAQGAALRLLFATWRHPKRMPPLPGADPDGRVPTREEAARLHVTWVADYVAFLRDRGPRALATVRFEHPDLGGMDPAEWARWLRIYFRHHELRLTAGG